MNEKKLRILVAESNSGETTSVLRALYPEDHGELELTIVSGISTLIATLEIVHPEAIFLDLALALPEPFGAVRRVHRAVPEVPLIILVETQDKARAEQCLSLGAQDYLLKGSVDAKTLRRVLSAALERNTFEGLANLLRDPHTNLYTRDGFLTLGARAMEKARIRKSTLVLLCLRIANLQDVQASFGLSAVGTSVSEVAKALRGSFRRTDVLARLGESQFAALAVDAAEPSAPVLLQRLRKRAQVLNRDIGPWGPLDLRMSARFWSSKESISFSGFLDQVEAELQSEPQSIAEAV